MIKFYYVNHNNLVWILAYSLWVEPLRSNDKEPYTELLGVFVTKEHKPFFNYLKKIIRWEHG